MHKQDSLKNILQNIKHTLNTYQPGRIFKGGSKIQNAEYSKEQLEFIQMYSALEKYAEKNGWI